MIKISTTFIFIFSVKWQEPQVTKLSSGYKVYSSPPPGSGAITESIIKMFDNFGFGAKQRSDKDVYLKLLECFKFAYAQRSKLGDPYNSPYQSEIEKVSSYVGNETIFCYSCIMLRIFV